MRIEMCVYIRAHIHSALASVLLSVISYQLSQIDSVLCFMFCVSFVSWLVACSTSPLCHYTRHPRLFIFCFITIFVCHAMCRIIFSAAFSRAVCVFYVCKTGLCVWFYLTVVLTFP